jgi:hypothetical protein
VTQEGGAGQRQPTEEEIQQALEEQMRRIQVRDVLLQTVVTLVNLSARRLGLGGGAAEERDVEQARLGIDAVRALMPLLPGEEAQPIREALSQLQLAYAQAVQGGGEQPRQPDQPQQPEQPAAEDAERAKARAKIWTPPGT